MKSRNVASFLTKILENQHEPQSRIVVLTGARQTGKTTLARTLLPDYRFLSIEDPVLRQSYARLTAAQRTWSHLSGSSVMYPCRQARSSIIPALHNRSEFRQRLSSAIFVTSK